MIQLVSNYLQGKFSIPQGGRIILDGNALVMTELKEEVVHDGYFDSRLAEQKQSLLDQAVEIDNHLRFDSPPSEPQLQKSMLTFSYGEDYTKSVEYQRWVTKHSEWQEKYDKWSENHYGQRAKRDNLLKQAASISPNVPPITKTVEVIYNARDVAQGFITIPYLSKETLTDLKIETACGRIEFLLNISIDFRLNGTVPSASQLEEFNNEIQHQGKSKAQVVPSRKFGYEVLKDTVESFI